MVLLFTAFSTEYHSDTANVSTVTFTGEVATLFYYGLETLLFNSYF